MESFARALELDPRLGTARLNRAVAALRTGDYAVASSDLQALYKDESSPLRATAAYHLALVMQLSGKWAEAEAWAAAALAIDPVHDAATLLHGSLLERRREFQGAGKAYREFLKRHPDSIVGLLRFGVAAHGAGYTDVSAKYLRRVVELAPDSIEAVEARKFLVMWE